MTIYSAMTEAQKLLREATFDADIVKMMGEVFDTAWALIEHAFQGQPQSTIDTARSILAKAIVNRVSLGSRDPDLLKDQAIREVKLNFHSLPI